MLQAKGDVQVWHPPRKFSTTVFFACFVGCFGLGFLSLFVGLFFNISVFASQKGKKTHFANS